MDAIENKKAKAFIEDIIEVSKKHGLSLGHEDIGGKFQIYPLDDSLLIWLKDYSIGSESHFYICQQVHAERQQNS